MPSAAPPSPGGPGAALDGPPQAALAPARAIATVAGTLGSFSWDGLVSDAPWIAGARMVAARGDRLAVALDPGVTPVDWQARWAPLVAGQPGTPRDGGSGSGKPVALRAPPTAGPWTLMVTARFGPGRHASWTWRVDVSP